MTPDEELRSIVDANKYMTLGTVDDDGRPRVSPVYFAHAAYREFLWVSYPGMKHSRNVAARPQVSIVIFDSTVPVGAAQAVYVSAHAEELTGAELARGVEVFSRRSLEHDAPPWTLDDVREPASFRLYRATATEHSVLRPQSERLPVQLGS